MDPRVYNAAMEGKAEFLDDETNPLKQDYLRRAAKGNTVLHIAARYGTHEWIQKLFSQMDPTLASSLLIARNFKGEMALHVAAREGQFLVIRELIQHAEALGQAKDILTSVNEDGDTALHIALRSSIVDDLQDLETLQILVLPKFAYSANKAGETPLYLAAECECSPLVRKIAENVTSSEPSAADYGGPGGRTALHAAVITNNEENTDFLLNWKTDLVREPDLLGWTPIHCAAEFGHAERVKKLLEVDKFLPYLTTTEKDGKSTALHIAAQQGCVSVIKELVSRSAGCWEMVNGKGQNVLHVAIEYKKWNVVNFFKQSLSFGSLLNQEDIHGNTPVHLAARDSIILNLSKTSLHSRLLKMSFNKENQTPLDLLAYSNHGRSSGRKELIRKNLIEAGVSQVSRNAINISGKGKKAHSMKKTTEALSDDKKTEEEEATESEEPGGDSDTALVVAALVATMTFAAGIAVPGGYNSNEGPNQGSAMLLRDGAFITFVVADSLSFVFSTLALLCYIATSFNLDKRRRQRIYRQLSKITCYSVLGMVLAFMTGTYSVLSHLPSLAVPLCVVSGLSFVGYVKIFFQFRGLNKMF